MLKLLEKSEVKVSKPPTDSDLFASNDFSKFASSKVLWEVSNILTRKQDLPWEDTVDGKHIYTSETIDSKGELVFWVTGDSEAECTNALASEAATTVIQTFDIRAVCMHLIYAAHAASLDKPWLEEFVIDDRQIASYLGLNKRKDLKTQDKLKLIERLALQPAQICMCLRWPTQGRVRAFQIESSKVWEISLDDYERADDSKGLIIKGRAGEWAKYFLNRQGQAEDRAFYQYGLLSKQLLQAIAKIWQRSQGAARMLAWLVFKTRVGSGQWLLTNTLMGVAYGQSKVVAAQSEPKLRTKLANTWDNDLLILHDTGWNIDFDPLTYPLAIQPDWRFVDGERERNKRPRGFWEQLRNGRLLVHPPLEIAAGLSKLKHKLILSKPKELSLLLTGEEIKAARKAKGWNQQRLAQELGKSNMWVSLIESDRRKLTGVERQQIRLVLDFNDAT